MTHRDDEAAQTAHYGGEQDIPDGIPEWAQYPIPYLCEGDRLWLLSRAGNRWWLHDEGWRTFRRCDPQMMLTPDPAETTPPILAAVVIPAINEAFADAGAADIASSNAERIRALAAEASAHATSMASQAHISSLRAADELQHVSQGLYHAAEHREAQLQITTAAEALTHRVVLEIEVAQEGIVNPAPPQTDGVDTAWHSTLSPTQITSAGVATTADDHDAGDLAADALTGTATTPQHTPAAAPGGILSLSPAMPSISAVFPWPAAGCTPSQIRAQQMRARRSNQ